MIRTTVRSFISYILLGMFIPSVVMSGGTPDGFPPAKESICDFENGAAYGLCNAYCEAMDCDAELPDVPAASSTACQKVAAKFNNITGESLPCEHVHPCPLLGAKHFDTFTKLVSYPYPIEDCVILSAPENRHELYVYEYASSFIPVAAVWESTGWTGSNDDGTIVPGPVLKFNNIDEYDACYELLQTAVDMNSLTCRDEF